MQAAAPFVRRHPWLTGSALLAVALVTWLAWLDYDVTRRFEGRRWDLPAHVYARPLELYVGLELSIDELEGELERLGYARVEWRPPEPGTWRRLGDRIELWTRPFRFWDGPQPPHFLSLTFRSDVVTHLGDGRGELAIARLEPLMIGSLFPAHGEDRLIVSPDQVPPLLPAALKAVEDRRFEQHFGVDPVALGRALVANLRAGSIAQGGSTLTQQLVKNYFLDNRRTLLRKVREAVTAVILEWHYDKDELMNAYINEVYMGQDGNRAIHGFGLASRFYFSRPLAELDLHEVALLVALVRGPGYYDPYRHPARALERRNLVLELMAETDAVNGASAREAAGRPLDLWDRRSRGASYYPAYLQLVRRQLGRHYREEDLTREGLRVFTSLDPGVQALAERALAAGLERLEAGDDPEALPLAGAVVVTSASSAEVLAVVGDRKTGFEGFNRALDARRPIGSLVKPAVYLAALRSGRYTLASTVLDEPLTVSLENGKEWTPDNFDNEAHGEVSLLRGLAESLNLATVRLGLDVGLASVAQTLADLGADGPIPPYPSLLLGAIGMTPMEVAELYGTLANGGFRTPHRAVRSVVDSEGKPLMRYPIEVRQSLDPALVHQLNQGLVEALRRGTGRSAQLPSGLVAAGKTGTSDGFRDSWFAGFSGRHVIVVWIGYDDNRSTGQSGSTAALPVWADILGRLDTRSWSAAAPPGTEARWLQYETGLEVSSRCPDAVSLALPPETDLRRGPRCGIDLQRLTRRTVDWLGDVIERD